jgi:hypothetical protein
VSRFCPGVQRKTEVRESRIGLFEWRGLFEFSIKKLTLLLNGVRVDLLFLFDHGIMRGLFRF